MNTNNATVRAYFRVIGRKGGRKSRRQLSADEARRMVAVREARKAFKEYKAQCFWSFRADWHIGIEEIPLVIQTLKQEGDRQAFERAPSLEKMLEQPSCP